MAQQFFEELSRCLRKEQIESRNREDRRLEVFLHGQPVLSVSPGNEVFLLPAGSKNPEANELYHRVATAADRVFEYEEAAFIRSLSFLTDAEKDALIADYNRLTEIDSQLCELYNSIWGNTGCESGICPL